MSYQLSVRATNVKVGDRVNKDRRFHDVKDINLTADELTGYSTVNLVFGNGSTIPLRYDDYVTVKRSSTATTPERKVAEKPYQHEDATEDQDILDLDGDSCECGEDYELANGTTGHHPWCPNK